MKNEYEQKIEAAFSSLEPSTQQFEAIRQHVMSRLSAESAQKNDRIEKQIAPTLMAEWLELLKVEAAANTFYTMAAAAGFLIATPFGAVLLALAKWKA